MKIVITGGHHNSALVIAEDLRSRGYQIVWVGHRHTMVDDPHESLEYQEVTRKNFPFLSLAAGKFHAKVHPLHWLRLPWGLAQALWITARIKPQLVIVFGGYIAVPIAIAAWLYKIPVIVCEQTTAIGRANQLISKFSQHNFLAWDSSLAYFPPTNSQIVGLPVPTSIWRATRKKWFSRSRPIIVVTGGKQGAHAINQVVFSLIPGLIHDFNIIHQTGATIKTGDNITAAKTKNALPQKLQEFYHHQAHFSAEDMLEALKVSRLVISRAGAHIIYELLALKKPAILIPLPFSYLKEQALNAQKLADINQALIISQRDLNPQTLLRAIHHPPQPTSQTHIPVSADANKIISNYILARYPHVSRTPKTT